MNTPREPVPHQHAGDRLTPAEGIPLLTGASYLTLRPHADLGLAPLVLSNGPYGVAGPDQVTAPSPGTAIPAGTTLAATWSPDTAAALAEVLAAEAHLRGVHVLLAPCLNLMPAPTGGRNAESLGEDPYLTATLGAAFIRALQARGVAATAKHFVGNDIEAARLTARLHVDETTLRETLLRPFETAVREAGVWAVMAAYTTVGGTTMVENRALLHDLLKDEWGFDGVVMCDWRGARTTVPTAEAGLDLVMPGPHGPWGDALLAAVDAGDVAEDVVADKIERLLRLARRTGALGEPAVDRAPVQPPYAPEQARPLLRAAAAQATVVLRRPDAWPPLPAGTRRVALIGPLAERPTTGPGGSAAIEPHHADGPRTELVALVDAETVVTHHEGVRLHRYPRPAETPATGPIGAELVAHDGTVLHCHTPHSATALWGMDPRVPLTDAATARLTLTVRPAHTTHLVCWGTGHVRILFDGVPVREVELARLTPDALAEALLRPPRVDVPLPEPASRDGESVLPGSTDDVVVHVTVETRVAGTAVPIHRLSVGLEARRSGGGDDALDEAVRAAADSDVAVVVVGTTPDDETEGDDRATLALPGRQDELVRRVAAVAPRTVVVVNAGAPVHLPWSEEVETILLAGYGGQEGAGALADVLTGRREPAGRLPYTIPTGDDDPCLSAVRVIGDDITVVADPVGHRRYAAAGVTPRYPFGHGLGWTTFETLDADLVHAGAGDGAAEPPTAVRVTVRNTGPRTGTDVLGAYLSVDDHPERRLVGFATIPVPPDTEAEVTIPLDARALHPRNLAPTTHHTLTIARSATAPGWTLTLPPAAPTPNDGPNVVG